MAEANANAECLITLPNYPVPRSGSRWSEGISDMAIRTQVKGIAFRIVSATTGKFTCLLAQRGFASSDDYAVAAADVDVKLGTRGRSRIPFRHLGFGGSRLQPNARRHGYRPRRTSR